MAYESTSVPVERSQGEIRKLLAKHGVSRMILEEARDDFGGRWASVSMAHQGRAVRTGRRSGASGACWPGTSRRGWSRWRRV